MHTRSTRFKRRCAVLFSCFGTAATSLLSLPNTAEACSWTAPPQALVGYPSDGDVVPVDVVPYYDMNRARLVDDAALTSTQFVLHAADGSAVSVTAKHEYAWSFELVFGTELRPNTEYSLVTTIPPSPLGAEYEQTIRFKTGAGKAPAPQKPAGAYLQHYRLSNEVPLSTCDVQRVGTCLALPAGASIALTFVDDFAQEWHRDLALTPRFTNLSGVGQQTPFRCARLRTRAANGALSEAVTLCGADTPIASLSGSAKLVCTSEGITQDGRPIEPRTSCSVRAVGAPVPGTTWLTLVLGALAVCFARRVRKP